MKKTILISIIYLLPLIGFSQNSVEFTIGVGGTIVDIESIVEQDEAPGTFATDWGTTNWGISGQYVYATEGIFGFGMELMYQDLYWYSVKVPYGTQNIYRTYNVSAFKITPIFRIGANNNFSFDFGPELNFIDGLKIGLLLSLNYYLPISDKIDIPLKFRIDIIDYIVVTMPISFNAGVRIKI